MTRNHFFRAAGLLAAAGALTASVVALLPHFTHSGREGAGTGTAAGRLASAAAGNPTSAAPPADPGTLSASEEAALHLEPTSVHQRGRFTSAAGKRFGVYVGTRSDNGRQCVMLVGGGGMSAGCDPTMFSNGPVAFVEAFSGGPGKSKRTDFELAGVVADDVARLDVTDSLGRVTRIDTSTSKGFFFELTPGDLKRGVDVSTLVARDAAGAAIASFDASEPDG
jgi:hypothetical protein